MVVVNGGVLNLVTHPNTPTATAASRNARSCSALMSRNASGRMVAVFLGCLSFCTAETQTDKTSVDMRLCDGRRYDNWWPAVSHRYQHTLMQIMQTGVVVKIRFLVT